MKGYPVWFTALKIHVVVGLLFVSGVLLVPSTLNAYLGWELTWRLSSDARLLVTAAHVAVSFMILFLMGALWSIHVRYWWRKRQRRVSGAALLGTLGILILSSLPVLYASSESLVGASALAHAGVGLALVIPYAFHAIIGVRKGG